MKTDTAVKIIIVLLVIMIAAVLGLLFIVNNEKKPSLDIPNTSDTVTDGENDATDKAPPATNPPSTNAPSTNAPSTNPPATVPPSTDGSEPPVTAPPVSSENPNGTVDMFETYSTDTGTALNMHAKISAISNENGKVDLSVIVSLEHYSMSVRGRKATLVIGEKTYTFAVDEIRVSENVLGETVIFTFEDEFEYGETLDIFIEYPYSGKYSGVEIDALAITASLILK